MDSFGCVHRAEMARNDDYTRCFAAAAAAAAALLRLVSLRGDGGDIGVKHDAPGRRNRNELSPQSSRG